MAQSVCCSEVSKHQTQTFKVPGWIGGQFTLFHILDMFLALFLCSQPSTDHGHTLLNKLHWWLVLKNWSIVVSQEELKVQNTETLSTIKMSGKPTTCSWASRSPSWKISLESLSGTSHTGTLIPSSCQSSVTKMSKLLPRTCQWSLLDYMHEQFLQYVENRVISNDKWI